MSDGRLHVQNLTPGDVALLKDIAEAAADKSVAKMLTAMGLDPANPIGSQDLFGVLRDIAMRARDPEHLKDQEWMRRTRQRSEGMVGKVLVTATGLVVVGAMHTLWMGLRSLLLPPA